MTGYFFMFVLYPGFIISVHGFNCLSLSTNKYMILVAALHSYYLTELILVQCSCYHLVCDRGFIAESMVKFLPHHDLSETRVPKTHRAAGSKRFPLL